MYSWTTPLHCKACLPSTWGVVLGSSAGGLETGFSGFAGWTGFSAFCGSIVWVHTSDSIHMHPISKVKTQSSTDAVTSSATQLCLKCCTPMSCCYGDVAHLLTPWGWAMQPLGHQPQPLVSHIITTQGCIAQQDMNILWSLNIAMLLLEAKIIVQQCTFLTEKYLCTEVTVLQVFLTGSWRSKSRHD